MEKVEKNLMEVRMGEVKKGKEEEKEGRGDG